MKTTAAVIPSYGQPFDIRDLTIDAPAPGEVLVRIVATGICHSDVAVQSGAFGPPTPIVLGHEGAGVVEAVGDGVTSVAPGDHVVLSYASCGHCGPCGVHAPQYCASFGALNFSGLRANGTPPMRDGDAPVYGGFFAQSSFASLSLALERNTVKVDKSLPLELLGPLGCGLQTGAGTVLNTLKAAPGSSLVVFGVGTVGMAAVMAAKVAACATIVAVDIHDSRLDLARDLGATHTLRGDAPDLAERLREILPTGANATIDTSGQPHVIRAAIDILAGRGTCVVLAVIPGKDATFPPGFLLGGRSIRGATEGDADPQDFIPLMLKLHAEGRFPFEKLVRFYDLADINTAIADMHHGTTIKPILRMPA
jgi:aryl-alcohol dehydrogenase